MSTVPACPQCGLENTYLDGALSICADCGFEWSAGDAAANTTVVRDSNGNVLQAGDTVTVIKDLKVKGSSIPLKQGTVIRNIRLVEDDAEHIEGNSDKDQGPGVEDRFPAEGVIASEVLPLPSGRRSRCTVRHVPLVRCAPGRRPCCADDCLIHTGSCLKRRCAICQCMSAHARDAVVSVTLHPAPARGQRAMPLRRARARGWSAERRLR
ncbi:hypothetical protein ACU11_14460 [Xanthomonas oryzae pv. oryzicola]|nr:hypothetical protein ACU11_14460 [Xanthomonas oryzae pv. oryzicola]